MNRLESAFARCSYSDCCWLPVPGQQNCRHTAAATLQNSRYLKSKVYEKLRPWGKKKIIDFHLLVNRNLCTDWAYYGQSGLIWGPLARQFQPPTSSNPGNFESLAWITGSTAAGPSARESRMASRKYPPAVMLSSCRHVKHGSAPVTDLSFGIQPLY